MQHLQSQLQQLELQVGLIAGAAGAGRAPHSGSEARYYALNKKMQAVRAEILKESRGGAG
jgi:hypothetical protein